MRIFSIDGNPKAEKAKTYEYLNAIHYMAPYDSAGAGNLCPHATASCKALCLGLWSGRAGMVHNSEDINPVRAARIRRARMFMANRAQYLRLMVHEIDALLRRCKREKMRPCIRLNGSQDIAWEGIRFGIERDRKGRATAIVLGGNATFFTHYRGVQFTDYTKNPQRFARPLPENYCLVFSRSEANERDALRLLERGHNVAVVFAVLPARWRGYRVIDGDRHDLRHLDPCGVVVGLTPKGMRARHDWTGFVVR
jgi:hypothetical protein